jgi:NADH-quinone oxidoreductase subunit M
MSPAILAPALVGLLSVGLLLTPTLAGPKRDGLPQLASIITLVGVALASQAAPLACAALAGATVAHAASAWSTSRTGAVTLAVAAALQAAVAALLTVDQGSLAFAASLVAIALRAGVMPLHLGVASLCDRAPGEQTRQFSTMLPWVFIHLRFLDHHPAAYELAPLIVRVGAVATITPALLALVSRDVRDFYRSAVLMHGGMVIMAVGAAGRGHYGAALFAVVTMGVALAGLSEMIAALEARCGYVTLDGLGGRVQRMPLLAAGFGVFGFAGVGVPGTAGFIADDLLLHGLWEESVFASVAAIFAAATLAIATLRALSAIFLGPERPTLAPDLLPAERAVAVWLVVALVLLGVWPKLLMEPANALLGVVPELMAPR